MKVAVFTGAAVGGWSVVRRADGYSRAHWLCRCECGAEKIVDGYTLSIGVSTSCGCRAAALHRKHGCAGTGKHLHKRTKEYECWHALIQRCTNPRASGYEHYGARGVSVCQRWRESFVAFREDMGTKPSPKHSIDRIDVNGNYEPGNCRWATQAEQGRNTRRTKLSVEKAAEIRRRREAGETTVSLGAVFGIHPSGITRLMQGKTWASC